jgi:hypothetical protein
LIDNQEIRDIFVSDIDKDNNKSKLDFDQPLLNMEQQEIQNDIRK